MKKHDNNCSVKNYSQSTQGKEKSFDLNFTLANFKDDSENIHPSLFSYNQSDKNPLFNHKKNNSKLYNIDDEGQLVLLRFVKKLGTSQKMSLANHSHKKNELGSFENRSCHKKGMKHKDEQSIVKYHSARDSSLPSKNKYRKCEKCKNHQNSLLEVSESSKRKLSFLDCFSSARSTSKAKSIKKKSQKNKKTNKRRQKSKHEREIQKKRVLEQEHRMFLMKKKKEELIREIKGDIFEVMDRIDVIEGRKNILKKQEKNYSHF